MAIVGRCNICGGNIIEDIQSVKLEPWDPPIYGPGSRGQYGLRTVGHFCEKCGIMYRWPIPEKEKDNKKEELP